MAEEHSNKSHEYVAAEEGAVETKDRGMFDFLGKKEEEKPQDQEVIVTEFHEKVHVSEPEPKMEEKEEEEEDKKKHGSLLDKLHRSGSSSSSSSSSDEEECEGEEKKKKKKEKKGLKEKISGEKVEEKHEGVDTSVPVEKCDEVVHTEGPAAEEKKGFLEKIKEKLPGQQKKTEEVPSPPPTPADCAATEGSPKEKKGIFDKIKEKIPGYHSKPEEEKEKEKECASH